VATYTPDLEELARRFTLFGELECRDYSPLYEELALGIAADVELLELLTRARPGQRRPTLFLAAVNYLGGAGPFASFRAFCLDNRDAILEIIETRATQTNEPRRSAVLLPLFRRVPEPLAVVEVGTSAGLNLLFDRYAYDYDGVRLGTGAPLLSCSSYLVPDRFPEVASRVGIDREPADVRDEDAVAWLRACVFADQHDRVERLEQAVEVARQDPPPIVTGDVLSALPDVAAAIPGDAHLVVFHTWTVTYFLREERVGFFDLLDRIGGQRDLTVFSAEGGGVVPDLGVGRTPSTVVGEIAYRNGAKQPTVIGSCHPHGAWLNSEVPPPI
jgi:hypothetical protein